MGEKLLSDRDLRLVILFRVLEQQQLLSNPYIFMAEINLACNLRYFNMPFV